MQLGSQVAGLLLVSLSLALATTRISGIRGSCFEQITRKKLRNGVTKQDAKRGSFEGIPHLLRGGIEHKIGSSICVVLQLSTQGCRTETPDREEQDDSKYDRMLPTSRENC